MKAYYLLFFFIFSSHIGKSQKYSFPLYFEDSVGNKDTLYFGEDPSSTFGIDEQFGEVNLLNEPIDSTFEVFFTNAVTGHMYDNIDINCNLENYPQIPSYISKKQYNSFHNNLYDWIELGMISKNWPVTISWNKNEIDNYVSDQGNSGFNLYLYSWNPPNLVGDFHCCGYWPNDYTRLNDTSQVSVEESNFCHYATTISKDTVNLFFIYYSSFTGFTETIRETASFRYNPNEKSILFLNNGEIKSGIIEVYDILGRVRIRKSIDNFTDTNLKIDTSFLSKGIYIIWFSSIKSHSNSLTKKILIL